MSLSNKLAAGLMAEMLSTAFDWDLDDPSTKDTPQRFIKYLQEFHQPFEVSDVLGKKFESGDDGMVIQTDIPFRMICEHHLLPALGTAAVGFVPDGFVIGLSKVKRLVSAVGTEQPSLQEHVSTQIADHLMEYLNPKGVMVVTKAIHSCMSCRGANAPNVHTTVSVLRGCFFTVQSARMEFLALAGIR